MKDFIPQIEPWIDEEERTQLNRVIDSTYVTEHNLTKEFEERIKDLSGARYAVAVTNGTAALYCCLKALGIGPGDEVIVPNMTFVATSNAVIMAGAKPVFCEVLEDTFCIDPDKMESLVNKNTKAVMPVHLYGQSADMDSILAVANKHSIKVIEDAAQGVGVKYKNKHVGALGDCGILSFYGNKTITCGEGGVILTDDKNIKQECYRLKNHGRDKKGIFKHDHIGYNFSFTEMQAAIGIAQMNKLNKIISKKAEIQKIYHKELIELKDVFTPAHISEDSTPVFWFTSYLTDRKQELQSFLYEKGIQTRDFFYPLHLQPCYSNMEIKGDFSISEKIYDNGISLPSAYNLTIENQYRIIEAVKEFYGR